VSIGILYPYQSNPEVWSLLLKIIRYQWLFYIVLSALILRHKLIRLTQNKEKRNENDIWLLSILFGNVIIWFAHFTAAYTSYIVGALSFSFVFYLSCLVVFFHRRKVAAHKNIKYVDKKIIYTEAENLITKLQVLMTTETLYTNANLTMPQVARKMSISTQQLSQLLNDNITTSFSNFINEYRITKAKTLLLATKKIKMDDIAEQCGFNSNSTFYTAFKKFTGTTPAKFRDNSSPNI
jgi:AraC-like DNA-binding protein